MTNENEDLIELRRQYDDVYTGLNTYLGLGNKVANPSAGDDRVKVKPTKAPKVATPKPDAREFSLEDAETPDPEDDKESGYKCGACGESLEGEVSPCPHCGVELGWA